MLMQIRRSIGEHLHRYWIIYLTLAGAYIAGLIFGALGVRALGSEETSQLGKFLDSLLVSQPSGLEPQFLSKLARDMLIMMAGIWFLGLTVVGVPLVYLIVFTRGFILGFTVSFFIHAKGTTGLLLILTTVFFPAIFSIPLLLFGAGLATIFSFFLLRGKARGESLRREFFYYSLAALLVCCGSVLAGIAQGYFSLLGVRLFGL